MGQGFWAGGDFLGPGWARRASGKILMAVAPPKTARTLKPHPGSHHARVLGFKACRNRSICYWLFL